MTIFQYFRGKSIFLKQKMSFSAKINKSAAPERSGCRLWWEWAAQILPWVHFAFWRRGKLSCRSWWRFCHLQWETLLILHFPEALIHFLLFFNSILHLVLFCFAKKKWKLNVKRKNCLVSPFLLRLVPSAQVYFRPEKFAHYPKKLILITEFKCGQKMKLLFTLWYLPNAPKHHQLPTVWKTIWHLLHSHPYLNFCPSEI